MKSRKGQMEMIGLVVIVILITLGMLFLMLFALKNKDSQKEIFTKKGLSYSTMGAILKTEVECVRPDGRTDLLILGEDLIEQCAEEKLDTECSCGGKKCCKYLEENIDLLLSQTLGQWGKHYEFQSILDQEPQSINVLILKDKDQDNSEIGCPGERESSGLFPLNPSGIGLIENVLYVCD